jgi:F-type H+-transporting ATPase subunit delta
MSNNLAHPYANALFEVAKADNTVDEWLSTLNALSDVAHSEQFAGLVSNPKIGKAKILEILMGFLDKPMKSVKPFLALLQDNDRLSALPAIYTLFEQKVEDDRNMAKAVIQSAYAISDADRKKIEQSLSKKFGKSITANVEVNHDLIGGIKILINDTVIDYSVKGSLLNLTTQLIS